MNVKQENLLITESKILLKGKRRKWINGDKSNQFKANPSSIETFSKGHTYAKTRTRTQSVPWMLIASAIAEKILGLPRITKNFI